MSTPFRIKLGLATPFYLGHTMTLDALLSAAVFNKTGLMGEDTIPHIPLEQDRGIFQGSSLFCVGRYQHVGVWRVMSLRGDKDMAAHLFAPNGRGGKKYVSVDQQRGEYKANLSNYPGISASEVQFWGVGDGDKAAFLIENYIIGIGKRSNAGAGEITSVSVEEIPKDYSWITANGKPARPLPARLWAEIGGSQMAQKAPMSVSLPYWESETVEAVFPESLVV